VTPRGKWLR